ncbi:hypothetical protein [Pseudoalteromonas luteoviolacea]|uniref:Uncharacterized protein n=1 Tax=Pseudoalteromonas luteoviolacea S4060-1 TaxID=1365257 RepID=A0A167N0Y8_9GAMM|nr:hypothetical protein [Pseudoalteromonas luteoviolacea]KZN67289.1 hypothetical protein N478_17860 [Pseudoalteromonas luteoviolacea S4060-1]
MNINNLGTGYSGYNPLLKSNEEDIEQSKKGLTSETEKVSSSNKTVAEQKPSENKEEKKSDEVSDKDKKVTSILSLQQKIKALQLEQNKGGVDKSDELAKLKQNLDKELAEVQSLIRSQASTYISGLFSNAPATNAANKGMFFNNRA